MKRMMVIGAVAAAVVILAGAGMAVAAGGAHKAAHNGSAVCGKIMSITTSGTVTTIVVQGRKGTTTITADASTKVRVDKQKVDLANLTVGEKIRARVANGTALQISGTTKAGKVSHKHHQASTTPVTPTTPEAAPVAPVAPVTPPAPVAPSAQ